MRVYHGKNMIGDGISHAEFVQLFGRAVMDRTDGAFLLVRDDRERLEVAIDEGMLLLCIARNANDCSVSVGSTYVDAKREFQGLSGTCAARDENFIDPTFALQAVEAFYQGRRMSEF